MSFFYWISGVHPVMAAISNEKREVQEIWINNEKKISLISNDRYNNIIKIKKNHEINSLFKNENNETHQGIAARVKSIESKNFKEILEENQNSIIALDGIIDQRNIGSIIRSAVAFGVKTIILEKKNTRLDSNLLHKSSSGYIEKIETVMTSNIMNNIISLKKKGYYIIGLDSKKGIDLNSYKIPKKHVLIFGSEEKGLRANISNKCDAHLKIKMQNNVESLNVSNSAAIVLSRINF